MTAAPGPGAAAERPLLGVLLVVLAMALLPAMDAIAKALSARYPVLEIVWARYFFHFLVLLPVLLLRLPLRALVPARPAFQVLRGGLLLGSTMLFFAAISTMPLADALALFQVAPLVVTALSPLLLKEAVGPRRWAAVAIGLLGALVILRPGLGVLQWGGLLAVAAGTVHGLYYLATRRLKGSAPPLVTLAYTAMLGALIMTAILPAVWVPPTAGDLALMVCIGLIAACGHFLLIRAFEMAPAAQLVPYTYTEVGFTAAVGYAVFGDFPDPWTWAGILVIVGSGLYIALRERRIAVRV